MITRRKMLLVAGAGVALLISRCTIDSNRLESILGQVVNHAKDHGCQPTQPSNTGLFAYFPFNGDARDESGNNHNAEVAGPVLTTDRFGKANSAYAFDGVDDYIIVKDMSAFPAGNVPRTITGWFKSDVRNPYIMMLYGFGATQNGYNYQVGVGPNYVANTTEFRVNGWGDSYDWRTGVPASEFLDGAWHQCAVTYDGTTVRVYFDGVERAHTDLFTYLVDPANAVLVIGREIDLWGWEWQGALDEVRVYTKVLSAGEIAGLYHENGWPTTAK